MALKRCNRSNVDSLPSIKEKLDYFESRKDIVYGQMIPEPDYSDEESSSKSGHSTAPRSMVARNNKVNSSTTMKSGSQKENKFDDGRFDEQGLVLPKKIPNPCQQSLERKNVHRELIFNQKLGINVLNQKSELQKALEKHKDKQVLKVIEKEKQSVVSPLQKAIDERAQRLNEKKSKECGGSEEDPTSSSEFQKIQAKFQMKLEAK